MAGLRRRGRPRLTPSPLPAGCRFHGRVIQASVRKAGLPPVYEPFPRDTDPAEIIAWQKRTAAELELRYGGTTPTVAGTFEADAARYLSSVKALPDYAGRTAHIRLWVHIFQGRKRHTIKASEIRAVRDRWLTVGPKRRHVKGKGWVDLPEPLAPATVCTRLRALENLWTVMWPRDENPVRDVPEPQTPKRKPRALPYDVIDAILAVMPDRGQGLRGKPRSDVSKTKARLRLMAYTGLTHSQIVALKPSDFRMDPAAPAINRKPRGKGAGAAGGWSPVPADAIDAMQAFADADAWGAFARSSMHKSFRRACAALDLPENMTPYQLRHSYASTVLKMTGSLQAAQILLQHVSPKTTMTYAESEIDPWLAAAMAKVTGLRAPVAQGTEHRASNAGAAGSKPAGRAIQAKVR